MDWSQHLKRSRPFPTIHNPIPDDSPIAAPWFLLKITDQGGATIFYVWPRAVRYVSRCPLFPLYAKRTSVLSFHRPLSANIRFPAEIGQSLPPSSLPAGFYRSIHDWYSPHRWKNQHHHRIFMFFLYLVLNPLTNNGVSTILPWNKIKALSCSRF